MYQVYVSGKPIGNLFAERQHAEDYAKSVGGTVQPVPATQVEQHVQEKLTQHSLSYEEAIA